MFTLDLTNKWLGGAADPLVPGHPQLRIQVRPIDDDMRDDAIAAYQEVMATLPAVPEGAPVPEGFARTSGKAWKAYARKLIEMGIVSWEGFADGDGVALPASPDYIKAALAHPDIYDALYGRYAVPFMMRHAEKNVFTPSQNGTSGAVTAIVTGTTDAQGEGLATPARTRATNLKRRPAAASGKS